MKGISAILDAPYIKNLSVLGFDLSIYKSYGIHVNGLLKIIKIWRLQNNLTREVVFGPLSAGGVGRGVGIWVRYL